MKPFQPLNDELLIADFELGSTRRLIVIAHASAELSGPWIKPPNLNMLIVGKGAKAALRRYFKATPAARYAFPNPISGTTDTTLKRWLGFEIRPYARAEAEPEPEQMDTMTTT